MSKELSIAYLDNNATTLMPQVVLDTMMSYVNLGNPSASYPSATRCKKMMQDFRTYLAACVGVSLSDYDCIFTSGATESNCTIIQSLVERCRCSSMTKFHIVASSIEHKSIILMLKDLKARIRELDITYVLPDNSGHVNASDILRAMRADTQLVICMHANNETGAVMNIAEIGRAIKSRGEHIFFHCDIVQSFGKIPVNLERSYVDGAAISFHKLHGPPGVGAMIIRKSFIDKMCPLLYGTQSYGRRGGTENIIGIGASFKATQMVFDAQGSTIAHELELKEYLIRKVAERVSSLVYFSDYVQTKPKYELQIIVMGDKTILDPTRYTPGTLMLAVAKHVGPHACNTLIKQKLEDQRVIVSVGSACSTDSGEPSHVLTSMGASTLVTDGAIRVSMCAFTTYAEIDRFVNGFIAEAKRQYDITRLESTKKSHS